MEAFYSSEMLMLEEELPAELPAELPEEVEEPLPAEGCRSDELLLLLLLLLELPEGEELPELEGLM